MITPMKLPHKTALITGASSGIGLELAQLFAKDGYNLVLLARNKTQLDSIASDLRSRHSIQVAVIVQDLALPFAAQQIVAELHRLCIEIDVLVNNAGTQVYGTFADSSLDQQLALIQTNVTALVQLSHLLLPQMIKRGYGHILNIGSTGSFAPGPLNAVYCATKAFVLSFSQAIGAELAGTGVFVTVLCPGATDTAFARRHGMQDVRIFQHAMSAVQVAQIGYQAMLQQRSLVIAGFLNKLQVLSFQLMAPFLGWTPPAWLLAIGRIFMGRSTSKQPSISQL